MKRFLFILCIVLQTLSFQSLAQNNGPAVSMEAFEQGCFESEATIALKNNTGENINDIAFIIKYLDMNGKQMDYKEFSYNVRIAPGMTKKIDIPAYEFGRYYHYYKTKDEIGGHPAFKVEFELTGYNQHKKATKLSNASIHTERTDDSDIFDYDSYSNRDEATDEGSGLSILFAAFILLFVIGLNVGLYVLVAYMAKESGRSVVAWLLLSFIATPLLIVIILLCIGKSQQTNSRIIE